MKNDNDASGSVERVSFAQIGDERVLETKTATVRACPDGIVRVVVKPGAELTLEDVREHFTSGAKYMGGGKSSVLVDTSKVKSVSRAAREFVSSPEAEAYIAAQAIVVGSPVSRLIGNFFLGLNRTSFPTKLFTSESEAVAWLKGLLP